MKNKSPEAELISFDDFLLSEGYLLYTNIGMSMLPLLRPRKDIIEIRRKGTERFKKYDVVLYKCGSKYIIHRILRVRPKDYVLCGDHNIFREFGISDDQILGVMTRVIRNGKSITPDNKLYRLYVHLWCDFYPVRAAILYSSMKIRAVLSKIKRTIRRRNGHGSR